MIISGLKIKEKVRQSLIFLENWLAICLIFMLIFLFNWFDIFWILIPFCGIECGDGESKGFSRIETLFLAFCVFILLLFVMKLVINKH